MKGRHVKLATIPSMEEVDKERQRLESYLLFNVFNAFR